MRFKKNLGVLRFEKILVVKKKLKNFFGIWDQVYFYKSLGILTMTAINHQLSLFVPYMFPNITQDRVVEVFDSNHLGVVHHVDFLKKTDRNGKSYNAAYIHFSHWYENQIVANFQERVVNPDKDARVVYDDPWYWIVLENTTFKTAKPEEMEFVSADYAALLEKKLIDAEKRLEELEESSWERIAELEERVLVLEEGSEPKRGVVHDLRDVCV